MQGLCVRFRSVVYGTNVNLAITSWKEITAAHPTHDQIQKLANIKENLHSK